MARIRLTRAEAAALDRGAEYTKSRFLPGQRGPRTVWYHNPETGQEWANLPLDAWNLMKFINRKMYPGRATLEMREKWAEHQKSLSDPADKHVQEGQDIIDEHARGSEMAEKIEALTKVVADLTAKVGGEAAPEPVKEELNEESVEERQLTLSL